MNHGDFYFDKKKNDIKKDGENRLENKLLLPLWKPGDPGTEEWRSLT
jgi:hypothetical protein